MEGLRPADRVMFMCSFIRFVRQMAHQVPLAMTEDLDTIVEPLRDDDASAMVQTSNILHDKTRILTESLQKELDKTSTHRPHKVRALLQLIRERHGTDIFRANSGPLQNLFVMLVLTGRPPGATSSRTSLPNFRAALPVRFGSRTRTSTSTQKGYKG